MNLFGAKFEEHCFNISRARLLPKKSFKEPFHETLINMVWYNQILEIKCSAKWSGHDWERILFMVKQI